MVVAALAETSLIAHAKTSSPTDGFIVFLVASAFAVFLVYLTFKK